MPGIYLAGCEPATGKSAVALGLQQLLVRRVSRLGVLRPVVAAQDAADSLLDLLRSSGGANDATAGVSYEQVRTDAARALEEIVARYHALAAACDRVFVVGTDYAGVGTESEFAFNARVALNLGLPVICVVSGHDRRPDEIEAALSVALGVLERSDCEVAAAIANRVPREEVAAVEARLAETPLADTFVIPEVPLMAPTVGQVAEACQAEMIAGDRELLGREALDVIVGAMTPLNVIERLEDGALVITPGDRIDILLATLFAHITTTLPALSGIVLTGGLRPPEKLLEPLRRRAAIPPIVLTPHDTFDTARLLGGLEGRITADAPRKIDTPVALFEGRVDGDACSTASLCPGRARSRR